MRFVPFVILQLIFMSSVNAGQQVDTHLRKLSDGIWTVEYRTADPVKRLGFRRNPDQSRMERWQPGSDDFEIVYVDNDDSDDGAGGEYIVRKNRKKFSQVTFTLTPTYRHLSKDYAPFSPFSNGGLLFHSGRFFACVDDCNDSENDWKMALTVPVDEHIVLNGEVLRGSVEWHDKDSGRSIYVGEQALIETEHVIAVIDEGLPEQIKSSLSSHLPEMMDYFESHFGELPSKPMLFASYAKNPDSHSTQGGTLSNQIFMHWDHDKLEAQLIDPAILDNTTWFFAHEAGHLYQSIAVSTSSINASQSWIHEGNADMLASLALLSIYPESESYVGQRFAEAKAQCGDGLQNFSLAHAADENRFDLYYSCGWLIHRAIDVAVKKAEVTSDGIFSVWKEYHSRVKSGQPANQDTFVTIVTELSTPQLAEQLLEMVDSKLENPAAFIDRLTTNDGD